MTNILRDGIQSSAFSSVQEPQALILSPTRELAMQIFQECKKFSFGSKLPDYRINVTSFKNC